MAESFDTLNIDDDETVRLVEWISGQTGESTTEAIRKSLEERAVTLGWNTYEERLERIRRFGADMKLRFGESNEPLTKE